MPVSPGLGTVCPIELTTDSGAVANALDNAAIKLFVLEAGGRTKPGLEDGPGTSVGFDPGVTPPLVAVTGTAV